MTSSNATFDFRARGSNKMIPQAILALEPFAHVAPKAAWNWAQEFEGAVLGSEVTFQTSFLGVRSVAAGFGTVIGGLTLCNVS